MGVLEGCAEGTELLDGANVGPDVGDTVGDAVSVVGARVVGELEGDTVGPNVGALVGSRVVGELEGPNVGVPVGDAVGKETGEETGDAVGLGGSVPATSRAADSVNAQMANSMRRSSSDWLSPGGPGTRMVGLGTSQHSGDSGSPPKSASEHRQAKEKKTARYSGGKLGKEVTSSMSPGASSWANVTYSFLDSAALASASAWIILA